VIRAVGFTPDGKYALVDGGPGMQLWDLETAKPTLGPMPPAGQKESVMRGGGLRVFSRDGKRLLTGLALWD